MSASSASGGSPRVRVEDASTSLGRTYQSLDSSSWEGKAVSVPGLGALRKQLTTRSFTPRCSSPVLEAASMSLVNLRTATRADVLEYFEYTWDLTDTLCVRVSASTRARAPAPAKI